MSQPHELGVIHDIGFRHYTGPRLGRGYLLLSLYTESLRGAYGLGRSGKSKIMPFVLLTAMILPAFIVAVVTAVTNADKLPLAYTSYPIQVQTIISVFLAAQAPALVSRDLRFKVMPLYFSRPLVRNDYVLAKLAALTTAVFILVAVPLTVLYVGALLAKLPFWAQTRGYLASLVGAAVLALVLAAIGLLIASITPKRGFGVAAIITVLLMLSVVSAVLQAISLDEGHKKAAGYLSAINPVGLVDGVQVWVLRADSSTQAGPPGTLGGLVFVLLTVGLVATCYGFMLLRYRRVSAS
jgi:ABC-2 type transport system permease protein